MAVPPTLLFEATGSPVPLGQRLGGGGEGDVYALAGGTHAVKVIRSPDAELGEKLRVMVSMKQPAAGVLPPGFTSTWPVDLVTNAASPKTVAGYTMPLANFRYHLHQLKPATRGPEVDELFLFRTAKNLATCVAQLHSRGILVGDLNESNVLVGPTAEVTVIDTDSFQIRANGRTYRSKVGKVEFTARELFGRKYQDQDRTKETDAFALAVCVWLCLMEGNHPFAAKFTGTGSGTSLKERIERGIWAYASRRPTDYEPRPMAPPFHSLPGELQTLFRDAFEAGHHDPAKRPKPSDWSLVLAASERKVVPRVAAPPTALELFVARLGRLRARAAELRTTLGRRYLTLPPAVRVWAGRAPVAVAASVVTYFVLGSPPRDPSPPAPDTSPRSTRSIYPPEPPSGPGRATPRLWNDLRRASAEQKSP